jgi:hypothetical protein
MGSQGTKTIQFYLVLSYADQEHPSKIISSAIV